MSYNVFMKHNTSYYKGYTIHPWAIYKGDEPVMIRACTIDQCVEDKLEEAKQIIDEYIEKEKQNERSRNN